MFSYKPSPEMAGPLYGKDPWPLRFFSHKFDARCHNTLACSLVYNQHQFGTRTRDFYGVHDRPSGPPPRPDWMDDWDGHHIILPYGGETFPGAVEIEWVSMDGSPHQATLDLDALFKERLILHRVPREQIKPGWLAVRSVQPVRPSILVEVDDRTVNIHMRAYLVTCDPRDPDNLDKCGRRHDLMLAWTHTY